jgi:hypothetical protein
MDSDRLYLTDNDRRRASNDLEALYNLNYLICEEAHDPNKVRRYVNLSEQHLHNLRDILYRTRS